MSRPTLVSKELAGVVRIVGIGIILAVSVGGWLHWRPSQVDRLVAWGDPPADVTGLRRLIVVIQGGRVVVDGW